MPNKRLAWHKSVLAVFCKDLVCEYKACHITGTIVMFALITLSSVSMSLGGLSLTPALAAVILWVVIFFSAMAGLSRVFTKELETGTLFTLKVYASAQTVLFGKLMFNLLMLAGLIVLIIPLFVMFFAVEINSWPMLTGVLLLGGIGIAAVSTLTASIAVGTEGSGALFTVISFPLLIPLLLTATRLTNAIFAGTLPEFGQLIVLIGYDVTVIVAVSILFDFLW